jgi:CxxC motif-containing protein
MICIECPLACRVILTVDDTGVVKKITGNECKQGRSYILQEFKLPMRILTATVQTEGCRRPSLSVKSSKPLPKSMLRRCMLILSEVKTKPGLHIGDIIIVNILDTKVDIVCTKEL